MSRTPAASDSLTAPLTPIGYTLTPVDHLLLTSTYHCRLTTSTYLLSLYKTKKRQTEQAAARGCQRTLLRLTRAGLLARRGRQIGGANRGSRGFIYTLGGAGLRMMAGDTKSTFITNPSNYFIEHTLGLADLYTQLRVYAAAGQYDLLKLDMEPFCWREFYSENGQLKPDMYVSIGTAEEELHFFIEYDRATTHLPVIKKKMRQYEQYFHTGIEQADNGVFPQVIWVTPTLDRKAVLVAAAKQFERRIPGLSIAITSDDFPAYITKLNEQKRSDDVQ